MTKIGFLLLGFLLFSGLILAPHASAQVVDLGVWTEYIGDQPTSGKLSIKVNTETTEVALEYSWSDPDSSGSTLANGLCDVYLNPKDSFNCLVQFEKSKHAYIRGYIGPHQDCVSLMLLKDKNDPKPDPWGGRFFCSFRGFGE